jgi:folate-binding protein YgfZ
LQRQSTNDVRLLAPNRSVLTVLTSPTGRILDLLRLLKEEDTSILALTLPGYTAATGRYLKSRIFFMDKVSVEDCSGEWYLVDLDGAQAKAQLERLRLEAPGLDRVTSGVTFGATVRVVGQPGLAGTGYRLVAPAAARQIIEQALAEAGGERLDSTLYEILRIEAGLPVAGAELNERYTPLETGLGEAISSTKGCYTGQEVIARQLTYDKVTQHLAGLRLSGPVTAGLPVLAEGRAVGTVTSFAQSPVYGPIALAILKRPFHEPGREVQVGEGESVRATVSALPFAPGRPEDLAHLSS